MSEHYRLHKIANISANLGESPVWDERRRLLYFVDITEGRINVLTPQARVETVHQSTGRIGALALTDQGNLVFTEGTCVAILNVEQGVVTMKAPRAYSATNYRFNDGACDPQGRFITGLMDEEYSKNSGALYQYGRELKFQLIHSDMSLPNGLAWSKDGSFLFFVDSAKCSIFKAEYSSDGSLGKRCINPAAAA